MARTKAQARASKGGCGPRPILALAAKRKADYNQCSINTVNRKYFRPNSENWNDEFHTTFGNHSNASTIQQNGKFVYSEVKSQEIGSTHKIMVFTLVDDGTSPYGRRHD